MRAQNLTLLTDLYELTMMQGYFKNPTDQIVVFDAFYRKNPCGGAYAISVGLEQVIEYVRDLHFSPDDIDYLRSLHLFEDDFLEYLRGFHFTGDIYSRGHGCLSPGADHQGHCPRHGSPAPGDGNSEYD